MQLRLLASIGRQVAVFAMTIGLISLAGTGMTYVSLKADQGRADTIAQSGVIAPLTERIVGRFFAATMDSRGIYMSGSAAAAKPFVASVRGYVHDVEVDWAALKAIAPTEAATRTSAIERLLPDWVSNRTEVARLGEAGDIAAADRLGNNEAIRAVRKDLVTELNAVSTIAQEQARTARAQVDDGLRFNGFLITGIGIVLLLVIAVGLALVRRAVVNPLRELEASLVSMAAGRLDNVTLPQLGTGEIGAISVAARAFLQQLRRARELEIEREASQAARARRQHAMDMHTQEFGNSISGVMSNLSASAGMMRGAAKRVSDGSRLTRASASSTVDGATASARDLCTVASATEEMAASIGEISQQLAYVTGSVGRAVDSAAGADAKVAGLSVTADRIGGIVETIARITSQTNLLALNATIEAARAGEAGRGFAVVANEVKLLAAKTAEATNEIEMQIVSVRSETEDACGAMRAVSQAIAEVKGLATAIAAAVEEQAATTREISNSIQGVTVTTSEAVGAMDELLTVASSTDADSGSAIQAADEIGQTADMLRAEVTNFLAAMSRGEESERRRYERIPVRNVEALLEVGGAAGKRVPIKDISRGGISLSLTIASPNGTDLAVSLPGSGVVRGRIARNISGEIGIAFRQDDETLVLIDKSLDHLFGGERVDTCRVLEGVG